MSQPSPHMTQPVSLRSNYYPYICAVGLVIGSIILTSIGGEGGGDHILPWLGTLAVLTLIWLLSLRTQTIPPTLLLGVALAIRIAFLAMPTGYDVHRYIWEGKILLEGFNPYVHPPNDPLLAPFRDEIWKSVSHPGATAIYPPLIQCLFALMASVGFGLLGCKILFTLADLILCALLCKRFGAKSALIYAWNPLAAVSFAGGGHYDSLFMLAMVLAWFSFKPELGFNMKSALWIGASIGFKWMAAPLGLWLVIHQWRNHSFKKALVTGLLVAIPASLSWIVLSMWTGEWTLQLMPPVFSRAARSAELIPAMANFIFQTGHVDNRWFMIAMIISWIWVSVKCRTFLDAAQLGFLATFILSPMLHAWYFVWALPFAVQSKNSGYIALAASGILYYVVHYTLAQPGGAWTYTWWERGAIWLPFLIGYILHTRSEVNSTPRNER